KEQHLLGVAGRSSLRRTQEEAARVRSAAEDRDATERRAQRERHYRSFTRPDGTYGAAIQAPTAAGAEIDQAIEVVTDQIFEEKRRAGVHEPREASQFDALRRICRQHLEGRARAADEAQPCGTLPERYLI